MNHRQMYKWKIHIHKSNNETQQKPFKRIMFSQLQVAQ